MFKKITTISLAGISALALVNVNAAVPSDAVQNLHHKKKISSANTSKQHNKNRFIGEKNHQKNDDIALKNQTIVVPTTVSRVSEVPVGTYVTAQIGYADTHIDNLVEQGHLNSNGLAGRLALGYQLNKNLAVEAGFMQFKDGKTGIDKTVSSSTYTSNQYGVDIAGKGIMPLTHNVNLYGKAGVAYLTTRLQKTTANTVPVNVNDELNIAKHKWAPEVAIGMSYDVTPNMNVDTSLTHIHPLGSNRPGNINFLAVGVGYTFG